MSQTTIIAGRYEILDLIGRGGMGDVYRGRDIHTSLIVAVKLLHEDIVRDNPSIVDRFEREGEMLRRLNHPNIVNLLATVKEDGRHYLVMEYVGGGSLRDLLDTQERLPVSRVLNIALDLADALTRAHRLGIVHRDIKPDNVLLAEDGTPRLTDFGVAHMADRTRLTQTGAVIGTYAYLSPEACNGEDLDERADIWSFGVMLYEMLAGRPPFDESSTAAILTAILTKPAPDLLRLRDDVSEELVLLIIRMLEKQRDQRISSVRVVGAELEALIRGMDTPMRAILAEELANEQSRFHTPSDERVPAMRRIHGQGHGLSIYPAPGTSGIAGDSQAFVVEPKRLKIWKLMGLGLIMTSLICGVFLGFSLSQHSEKNNKDKLPPAIQVAPVNEGEYMVLVAPMEQLSEQPRSVTRFVMDNLKRTLETNVQDSPIRVREYPNVITSDEEALSVAEANGASVIIWGNYTEDLIQLEVQVGSTADFPYLDMDRDILERTANIRVEMTDPRSESVSQYALNVLSILFTADGDTYGSMQLTTIAERVSVTNAPIVDNTPAAIMHQASLAAQTNPGQALILLNDAIDLDTGNPLLYIERAMLLQRLERTEDSMSDVQTAARLGPDGWVMPTMLMVNLSHDEQEILTSFNEVVEERPDDWFPLFFRGTVYYQMGDYGAARSDLERAIAMNPPANFPYIYAALLALHEGRIMDAGSLTNTILTEFPDPSQMERLITATFGESTQDPFGLTLSAFGNLVLGQYDETITSTTTGIRLYTNMLLHETTDFYAMQGFAQCAQENYHAASDSYTQAITIDPDFMFVYLLRGEARLRLGQTESADADFNRVLASSQSPDYESLIESIRAGELGCNNFFSSDNPVFQRYLEMSTTPTANVNPGQPPTNEPPTEVAQAPSSIQPVAEGEIMVLVAQLEPTGGVVERDVTRFIVDNLRETLEQQISYSNLRIRVHPDIIRSDDEARQIAESTGASVIVWGNYNPQFVELEIQAGSLAAYRHMTFSRETIEEITNVRVRLTDERSASVAVQVVSVAELLSTADGDMYSLIRLMAVATEIQSPSAEIIGNDAAAHMHRASVSFLLNTENALAELNEAANQRAGNPLIYAYRSGAYAILEQGEASLGDLGTAQRLSTPEWTFPMYIEILAMIDSPVDIYTEIINLRADDWYPVYSRGEVHYVLGEYTLAKADFERAIELRPVDNSPYVYSLVLALREGRMADAQTDAHTILREYPNAEQVSRMMQIISGGQDTLSGVMSSTGTSLILGQYQATLNATQPVLHPALEEPGAMEIIQTQPNRNVVADLLLFEGIAYCNLGQIEQADIAYTQAITLDPDYKLLYLLRGSLRTQNSLDGAEADFAAAEDSTLTDEFSAWLEAAQQGDLTCANLFEFER